MSSRQVFDQMGAPLDPAAMCSAEALFSALLEEAVKAETDGNAMQQLQRGAAAQALLPPEVVKRYLIILPDTADELPLSQHLCRTVTLLSKPQTDVHYEQHLVWLVRYVRGAAEHGKPMSHSPAAHSQCLALSAHPCPYQLVSNCLKLVMVRTSFHHHVLLLRITCCCFTKFLCTCEASHLAWRM